MQEAITKYRTFLAVAEEGSVTAAARRLFVSQPAVSTDISTLEESLGVRLFTRSNRGVTLTEEGRVLFEYVQKAFSLLSAGEDRMREVAGLQSGALHIGASDMTLRFFLLGHIAAFHEAYPGIRLNVTNAPTPDTLEAIRGGLLDFGVVSGPLPEGQEEFFAIPVHRFSDIFITSPDHPLAAKTKITRKELAAYPMIMLEKNTSTRAYVSSWLGADFPPPAIELATSDLLLSFAERGIGVCSIAEDFAKEAIAKKRVRRLRLAEGPRPRQFYLVYLRRIPLSAAARAMIEMIGCKHEDRKEDL